MTQPEDIHQALTEFLSSEADDYWFIDERVYLPGDEDDILTSLAHADADLLATEVRHYSEFPGWQWWSNLHSGTGEDPVTHGVAALLPLMRASRAAAHAILQGISDGWSGHPEALIPTLVNRAGLKIEEIGGNGGFTPKERIGRWYDRRTWNWCGPVEHVPGMLHFPVPIQKKPLAEGRIRTGNVKLQGGEVKLLYVSPAGGKAGELLPDVLECFLTAGADCMLLQYDEADLEVPDGVRVIRDKGYKWQLAVRHLHPDVVENYDLIFFWDDDLGAKDFDPKRFARIMRANRLEMAQPAIQSPHGLSHAITKHRPCPPPWRDPDEGAVHPVVGRLTNFVEIMAPVFTREAWREFYGYLDPENRSGWGYDYIPLGRKGIVDALPVVHTRAVQSINGESERDLQLFLDSQGLFRHAPVEHGWLFEPVPLQTL